MQSARSAMATVGTAPRGMYSPVTTTRRHDRAELGEQVTMWLAGPGAAYIIAHTTVTQSSDHAVHCLTITLFLQTHAR